MDNRTLMMLVTETQSALNSGNLLIYLKTRRPAVAEIKRR